MSENRQGRATASFECAMAHPAQAMGTPWGLIVAGGAPLRILPSSHSHAPCLSGIWLLSGGCSCAFVAQPIVPRGYGLGRRQRAARVGAVRVAEYYPPYSYKRMHTDSSPLYLSHTRRAVLLLRCSAVAKLRQCTGAKGKLAERSYRASHSYLISLAAGRLCSCTTLRSRLLAEH